MATDLVLYRARIGLFAASIKPRTKSRGNSHCQKFVKGSDIHLRSVIMNIYTLLIFTSVYFVCYGHAHIIQNYAVPYEPMLPSYDLFHINQFNMDTTSTMPDGQGRNMKQEELFSQTNPMVILEADDVFNCYEESVEPLVSGYLG
ncbi:hypothetical protein ACF0H5_000095 [Mactra antiquata]